jgi:hypothetical protein
MWRHCWYLESTRRSLGSLFGRRMAPRIRAELAERGELESRLRVLGWTDDMASWMTASDVVVGNAGGLPPVTTRAHGGSRHGRERDPGTHPAVCAGTGAAKATL